MTNKSCPSCGGEMVKHQQGDDVYDSPKQEWFECPKCGSGEVEDEKKEVKK